MLPACRRYWLPLPLRPASMPTTYTAGLPLVYVIGCLYLYHWLPLQQPALFIFYQRHHHCHRHL